MFATIVIVLPTTYTGGEVRVVHGKEEKTFDYASMSQFSTSVLAWYADILHEVKPITSGFRLALSYNLIQPNRSLVALPPPGLSSTSKLAKIFDNWSKGAFEDPPDFVCYKLGHEYSLSNLRRGTACLNGADAHIVARIKQAAEESGVCLGFGQFVMHVMAEQFGDEDEYGYGYGSSYYKRRRYNCYNDRYEDDDDDEDDEDDEDNDGGYEDGGYEDESGDDVERTMSVRGLLDLDGNPVLSTDKNIPVDGENTVLIPKDAFRGMKPDRVEHGYTGNVSQPSFHLCLSTLTREPL